MTFEPSLAAPQALGALKGTHLRRPLPRSGAAPGLLTHKGINREDAIVHDAGVPGGPFGASVNRIVPSRCDQRTPEGQISLFSLPSGPRAIREPFLEMSVFWSIHRNLQL